MIQCQKFNFMGYTHRRFVSFFVQMQELSTIYWFVSNIQRIRFFTCKPDKLVLTAHEKIKVSLVLDCLLMRQGWHPILSYHKKAMVHYVTQAKDPLCLVLLHMVHSPKCQGILLQRSRLKDSNLSKDLISPKPDKSSVKATPDLEVC